MDVSSVGRHSGAGKLGAANLGRVIAVAGAALVVLWVWTAEAADPTTPKKPTAPAVSKSAPPAAKSSPTLQAPAVGKVPESAPSIAPPSRKGTGPTAPTASTREPAPGSGSKALPCGKLSPTLKTPGSSRPCPDGEESENEPDDEFESDLDPEPDSTTSSDESSFEDSEDSDDGDQEADYGDEGQYADDPGATEESSEDAAPSADFEELTGKIPGLAPFGGEESGGSEGSTVEGGRPWYEKLGKPGGGRPPVDDEE